MAGIGSEIYESTVVLPITEEARAVARRLAEGQPTPQKAEQVRLNTLAVSVVNNYLRMMDIPTDIAASYSRKPFMLLWNDIADLLVTGVGRLECRPVKAREQSCHVPVEVWDDRVGYIAVQMDEELSEAALLGFTQNVEGEEISLNQFQPLQSLLGHLNHQLLPVDAVPTLVDATKQLQNLSQWLANVFDAGWQTIDSLLSSSGELRLASAFRSTDKLASIFDATSIKANSTGGGKVIHLQTLRGNFSVLLAILITPDDSTSTIETQETNIVIKVVSATSESLPNGLQLMVLEESGAIFNETQAEPGDNYLQLPIGGHSGEKFSIKVALDGNSIIEDFVI
ncbi:MAG: DUF1822 family protein [Scytonematopsis contorta HA4267-MV1]|jgi:hypothetical protein|nr:DUF1822 family protein [Scytonematopsis contorta HA4267-MV1]